MVVICTLLPWKQSCDLLAVIVTMRDQEMAMWSELWHGTMTGALLILLDIFEMFFIRYVSYPPPPPPPPHEIWYTVMSLLDIGGGGGGGGALLFRANFGITRALIVCFDIWGFKQAKNSETGSNRDVRYKFNNWLHEWILWILSNNFDKRSRNNYPEVEFIESS